MLDQRSHQQVVLLFPIFLPRKAVQQAAAAASRVANTAWVTDKSHKASASSSLESMIVILKACAEPSDENTCSIYMAYDEMSSQNPLHRLYNCDAFIRFVKDVTSQRSLHRLADPIGACTVNIFKPSWSHAWHFDESEFTTTVCLQTSEEGGHFEYTRRLRSDQSVEGCAAVVADVINSRSSYEALPRAVASQGVPLAPHLNLAPFKFCWALLTASRQQDTETCKRDRLVGVLCFAREEGVYNSP